MVVSVTNDHIEGYVFNHPEDFSSTEGPIWVKATYGGKTFPVEEKTKLSPGTWFYPFPQL